MKSRKFLSVGFSIVSSFLFLSVPPFGVNSQGYSQGEYVTTTYTCPMHPEVVSNKPGRCPKCGMSLVESKTEKAGTKHQWNLHSERYTMEFSTEPDPVLSDEAADLRFVVRSNDKPGRILPLKTTHEKKLHLIVVSRDLERFVHVHPELQKDGSLIASACLFPGSYVLFADVLPEGAAQNQVFRFELVTNGAPKSPPASLGAARLESSPDDYTVSLSSKPALLTANQSAELSLNIEQNGNPVRDLKPYLGALGHMVIINEDTQGYLHTHPEGHEMSGAEHKATSAGPDVSFHTLFPVAGKYKVWTQFNHGGKIHTANFVVDVNP